MESLNQTLCDLAKYDIKFIITLIDWIRLASLIRDMIYNCLHDVLFQLHVALDVVQVRTVALNNDI